jgi:hypothetical protein
MIDRAIFTFALVLSHAVERQAFKKHSIFRRSNTLSAPAMVSKRRKLGG